MDVTMPGLQRPARPDRASNDQSGDDEVDRAGGRPTRARPEAERVGQPTQDSAPGDDCLQSERPRGCGRSAET